MDLSEHNYGVSVVNNSKYGGLIHGNLMRLSLLRSAKAPDDEADMGDHDFEYAIFPHEGTLGASTVRLCYLPRAKFQMLFLWKETRVLFCLI